MSPNRTSNLPSRNDDSDSSNNYPKLDNTNWLSFAKNFESTLIQKGMFETFNRLLEKLRGDPGMSDLTPEDTRGPRASGKNKGVWNEESLPKLKPNGKDDTDDAMIYSMLYLRCGSDAKAHIGSSTTRSGVKAYAKLEDLFTELCEANAYRNHKLFLELKMSKDETVSEFFVRYLNLVQQLEIAKEPPPHKTKCLVLIKALSSSFKSLSDSLVNTWDPKLTPESIKTKALIAEATGKDSQDERENETRLLMILEQERKSQKEKDQNGNQQYSRPPQKFNGSTGQSSKGKGFCNHCYKEGHNDSTCFALVRKRKLEAESGNKKAFSLETKVKPEGFRNKSDSEEEWYIDSGATENVCNSFEALRNVEVVNGIKMTVGNGSTVEATHKGTVRLLSSGIYGERQFLDVDNVYFVPQIHSNLLSLGRLTADLGATIKFDNEDCFVTIESESIFIALRKSKDGMYPIGKALKPLNQIYSLQKDPVNDLALTKQWHRRLGHVSIARLSKLMERGIIPKFKLVEFSCYPCILGKLAKQPFKTRTTRSKEILELLYTDLAGPFEEESIVGHSYYISIVDDYSRYVWTFPLFEKSEASEILQKFISKIERKTKKLVRNLRSDNGGEFIAKDLEKYLEEKGIDHQFTVPGTPQQNGVAEKMNRTLLERVKTMLQDAHLPKEYWNEALMTAAYLRNRCPESSNEDSTPHELFWGKPYNSSSLRAFGCLTFAHVSPDMRQKLDPNAIPCIFLGYSARSKSYRLWDIARKRIILSRSVKFIESELGIKYTKDSLEAANSFQTIEVDWVELKEISGSSLDESEIDEIIIANPEIYLPREKMMEPKGLSNEDNANYSRKRKMNLELKPNPKPSKERKGETSSCIPQETEGTKPSIQVKPHSKGENYSPSVKGTGPLTRSKGSNLSTRSENIRSSQISIKGSEDTSSSCSKREDSSSSLFEKSDGIERSQHESSVNASATEGLPMQQGRSNLRPNRTKQAPFRLGQGRKIFHLTNKEKQSVTQIPTNYAAAMTSLEKSQWISAMEEEVLSLEANSTWVELKPNEIINNVIGSRWVFDLKKDPEGMVTKYKGRLVGQGFSQIEGVDYFETYAPVVKTESIRVSMMAALRFGLEIHQLDFSSAFLNGELKDEIIHMRLPPNVKGGGRIVRLKKAIYGLKQAAHCWNQQLHDHLISLGYNRSEEDHCVYYKFINGLPIIIAIHVDDVMFCCVASLIQQAKLDLMSKFKMRDLGPITVFLGVHVEKLGSDKIYLNQTRAILDLLDKYDLSDCKPKYTPCESREQLSPPSLDPNILLSSSERSVYRSIVGSLLYIANMSRPDISYAVSLASRCVEKATTIDAQNLKRILRYLKATVKDKICLQYDGTWEVQAFSDASFANEPTDLHSTTGMIIKLGGGLIYWKSQKQKSVATSSFEAEIIAISNLGKEIVWLLRLLEDLKLKVEIPQLKVNCDNISAITKLGSPWNISGSKHVNIRGCFIRELAVSKQITINYVPTELMEADLLTKALNTTRIKELKDLIGMTVDLVQESKKQTRSILQVTHQAMKPTFKPFTLTQAEEYRQRKDSWSLANKIFEQVEVKWGVFTRDFFADEFNTKCKDYWSESNSAFNHIWTPAPNGYINGPFRFLPEIVIKAIKEKVTCCIVTPDWSHQSWYKLLQEYAKEDPIVIENQPGLFEGYKIKDGRPSWNRTLIWRLEWDAEGNLVQIRTQVIQTPA